jgi:iron complex transport system ATP-binding protein
MQPVLVAKDLDVGYRARRSQWRTVLSQINVALHQGEFACLLGPNGAGKSTLLRTLTNIQPPIRGSVQIGDVDIHRLSKEALSRQLSVVLTERLQVSNLTGYELVSFGRSPYTDFFGRMTEQDHRVVRWAIHVTHSEDLAQRLVSEMSDGERQRIMIARALAQEPAVMVLDEPTAFLDLPRRVEITALLRRLAHETGLAVLMSTHDLDLALRSSDSLWLVTTDGKLVSGAPEDLVLQGTLATTFVSDELHFDAQFGGFRHHQPLIGKAIVRCDGLPGIWMRHALEREGYALIDSGGGDAVDLEVEYTARPDQAVWCLRHGCEESYHHAIGPLIAQIRAQRSLALR